MSDILIRGMEIPKSCDKCKLCALIPVGMYGLYRKCMPLNRNAKITVRRKDCPLHELPEHGDLISLDMALDECKKPTIYDLTDVPDFLRELPVIIPTNKEKTK